MATKMATHAPAGEGLLPTPPVRVTVVTKDGNPVMKTDSSGNKHPEQFLRSGQRRYSPISWDGLNRAMKKAFAEAPQQAKQALGKRIKDGTQDDPENSE